MVEIVRVVRHDERDTELAPEFYHLLERDNLVVDTVTLQFEIKILFAENGLILLRKLLCQIALAVEQPLGVARQRKRIRAGAVGCPFVTVGFVA